MPKVTVRSAAGPQNFLKTQGVSQLHIQSPWVRLDETLPLKTVILYKLQAENGARFAAVCPFCRPPFLSLPALGP